MADEDKEFFRERTLARSKAQRLARTAEGLVPVDPPSTSQGRMIDVSAKPVVPREAIAEGFLRLKAETLTALAEGRGPKGDPFPAAQVAGILAAKKTPEIVPFCHPILLTSIDVALAREKEGVRVRATVRTQAQTGVEMEALAAVTGALLTVWDMTKALEKDATGNYPGTAIENVRVVSKTKGAPT
ncbi:MAG: cyclic pyranopterin monophosphate synthase MoaC [Candidatus Thermoplasmatota archaeon]